MTPRSTDRLIGAAITLLLVAACLVVMSMFAGSEIAFGHFVLRHQGPDRVALLAPQVDIPGSDRDAEADRDWPETLPRNVVLMIGDGMGIGAVSAASALLSPPDVPLTMERANVVGLMHTWSANDIVTDSAAAATALATGFKTDRKVVGMTPDGRAARNLFEVARASGMATGLITTSGLADGTPGGFLAHAPSREEYDRVMMGILDSGADVLIGGDFTGKPKAWRQPAYRDLVARIGELGGSRGYTVVRDEQALATAGAPLLALLPPRARHPIQHGPPLAVTTSLALDAIGAAPRGFLLVVECEVIDEAAHANDFESTIAGVRELDDALATVLEWADGRNDTLVLAFADHETGGPHLIAGEFAAERATLRWAHNDHSSQSVPVFAFGPGAAVFGGVLDNTEIAVRIARLLDLEPLPRLAESSID